MCFKITEKTLLVTLLTQIGLVFYAKDLRTFTHEHKLMTSVNTLKNSITSFIAVQYGITKPILRLH